MGAYLK